MPAGAGGSPEQARIAPFHSPSPPPPTVTSESQSTPARRSPAFVGREEELALLSESLTAANEGRPQLVWVEGDAGMGKTALMEAAGFIVPTAIGAPAVVRADATETSLRYGLATQLLEAVTPGHPPPAPSTDPMAVGAAILDALGETVAGDADGPAVIVIEDLHHCDLASAQALCFALRRLRTNDRLVVAVTARPDALERLGESWERLRSDPARTRTIRLKGLSPRQISQLCAALGKGPMAPSVAERLAALTRGHPLHARTLIEDVPMTVLAGPGPLLPVPRSLAEVFLARMAAISNDAQSLVMAASVVARPLPLAALGQVAFDSGAPGTDGAAGTDGVTRLDLHRLLDQGTLAGLLVETPDGRVACRHPLVQAAVIGDLSAQHRSELHRRAAGVLTGTERLGHLVAAAGSFDPDIYHELLEVARQRRQVGAHDEAADLLLLAAGTSTGAEADEALLDAAEALIAAGDHLRAAALGPRVEATAPSTRRDYLLGCFCFVHGNHEEARRHLIGVCADPQTDPRVGGLAASTLALGDLGRGDAASAIARGTDALAMAGTDPSVSAAATAMVALGLCLQGSHRQAAKMLDDWIDHHAGGLSRAGDRLLDFGLGTGAAGALDVMVAKGTIEMSAGHFRRAAATFSEAISAVRLGAPGSLGVQSFAYLANAELRLGRWDQALMHAELAVSIAHDTETVWSYVPAHSVAARILAWRGDAHAACAHQHELHHAADLYPSWSSVAWSALTDATIALLAGDHNGAADALAPLCAPPLPSVLEGAGPEPWLNLYTEALIGAGRLEEAMAVLSILEDRADHRAAERDRADDNEIDLFRLQALAANASGERDRAAQLIDRAIAGRDAAGDAPLACARVMLDAGLLHAHWEDHKRAEQLIVAARADLARLGCVPLVAVADEELEHLGATVVKAGRVAGLSSQEQAVASLAAEGLTNREIAAELYVSVKAVEYHLTNVYAKLAISSRRQLAAALRV